MMAKNPAHVPQPGERLQYVVVQGHPLDKVITCVRSVQQFRDNKKLKVGQGAIRAQLGASGRLWDKRDK